VVSLREIRAVTFDVGGTLIEPWPSVGHIYAEVAARQGIGVFDPEWITERFIAAWRTKTGFDYSRRAWRAQVAQTFGESLPPARLDELFQDLYRRFEMADAWRVFDDVTPTLQALRAAGFKLGVISNWDERLRPLLQQIGLSRWFDALTISAEAGTTKPAPGIFTAAATSLGLPPESILHVGDSPHEDVEGALSAGLAARLLQRGGVCTEPGSILSLRQMLAAID